MIAPETVITCILLWMKGTFYIEETLDSAEMITIKWSGSNWVLTLRRMVMIRRVCKKSLTSIMVIMLQKAVMLHRTPPITYTTPTNVLLSKPLIQQINPANDQLLTNGIGGETAAKTENAIWTAYIKKNQAYRSALSLIARLYRRMYLQIT